MPTIDYKGDGGPDGTVYGATATHLQAFYGKTPVVQPAATAQFAVTSTDVSSTVTSTGPYGYASSTVLAALLGRVNSLSVFCAQLRSDLVTLGIIKGSI
jgi:hypothetical protein